MKCDRCSNPATVHLTNITGKKKKEIHLCQECAEQQDMLQDDELNLPSIVQKFIGEHVSSDSAELSRLACPICGIGFMDFRQAGRLGCPHDYHVFREPLAPLLRRIHRHVRHNGKVPRNAHRRAAEQAELLELRTQLRSAVEAEAFEEAARLRDVLRQKETSYESG